VLPCPRGGRSSISDSSQLDLGREACGCLAFSWSCTKVSLALVTTSWEVAPGGDIPWSVAGRIGAGRLVRGEGPGCRDLENDDCHGNSSPLVVRRLGDVGGLGNQEWRTCIRQMGLTRPAESPSVVTLAREEGRTETRLVAR